jgi:hypothetical protein
MHAGCSADQVCAGAQPKSSARPFWPCHMRACQNGRETGAIRATHGKPGTLLSWVRAGQGLAGDDLLSSQSQATVIRITVRL